jgi:competence protein ComEA
MPGNQIKRILKEYFSFTRSDRRGIFIFLAILFLIMCFNLIFSSLQKKSKYDFTAVKDVIRKWEESQILPSDNKKHLFRFDPNTIDEESIDSLDFPLRIKSNILKYRNSGGHFRTVDDLKKIYGMTDSLFDLIKKFIVIPVESNTSPGLKFTGYPSKENRISPEFTADDRVRSSVERSAKNIVKIELNTADSIGLVSIDGIGGVLASRIIKYRNLLGGYYRVSQLSEVYGMRPDNYRDIYLYFEVDSSKIKKIRLNFDDFKEMVRHPYLDSKQVNAILKYRSGTGPFRSVDELIRFNLLDSVTYLKVYTYLTSE